MTGEKQSKRRTAGPSTAERLLCPLPKRTKESADLGDEMDNTAAEGAGEVVGLTVYG